MQLLSIKVIILDDHALVRAGIRSTLEKAPSISIIAEGTAGKHLEPLVMEYQPDVVLFDPMIPHWQKDRATNGSFRFRPARVVKRLRQRYPGTEFIVVTDVNASRLVFSLANAGVNGYLLKNDGLSMELATAITTVHSGGVCLSPEINRMLSNNRNRVQQEELTDRQIEVLQTLAVHSNELQRDIADAIGITETTMKKHVSEIRQRMMVKTTTAAIVKGMQLGIIPIDSISFPEY